MPKRITLGVLNCRLCTRRADTLLQKVASDCSDSFGFAKGRLQALLDHLVPKDGSAARASSVDALAPRDEGCLTVPMDVCWLAACSLLLIPLGCDPEGNSRFSVPSIPLMCR